MSDKIAPWPHIFYRSADLWLEITTAAWLVMQCFTQNATDATEAGGVLLGRHLADGSAIIVDDVTTPLLGDTRRRTHFHRERQRHQIAIDLVWWASNGTCTYVGEWHTHPEAIPTPSRVDWLDWQRRLATDHFTEPLFFVIVGTEQTRVWEGRRDGSLTALSSFEEGT